MRIGIKLLQAFFYITLHEEGMQYFVGEVAVFHRQQAVEVVAQAVENHKSYPYAAVRLNQQGTVIINVTIDANGNLISAGVVSSVNGNLDKAALNAVYSACPFSHGLGESISMNVPVNFYLN